jgi:hypothetical protein
MRAHTSSATVLSGSEHSKIKATTGRIFMKLNTWVFVFFEKLIEEIQVAQLLEALRYKPDGRGLDSQLMSLGYFH